MSRLIVALTAALLAALPAFAGNELPREIRLNGVEFLLVPGGWTYMPVPEIDPKTGHPHGNGIRDVKVWTDTLYLAKYEARARDFMRFMREGKPRFASHYDAPTKNLTGSGAVDGCAVRKDKGGDYYLVAPDADLPVTHLSWELANEFAQWMGFRLPTEAEWVRAFRSDDKRIYPWGNAYPDDTYAGFQEGATLCHVQPVTAFAKGQSPFGIYNMAGNVFEYTADWFNPAHYNSLEDGVRNPVSKEPVVVPMEPKAYRVLRGGRWASGTGELSIYGNRDLRATNEPFICFGARFALDADAARKHLEAGTAVAAQR